MSPTREARLWTTRLRSLCYILADLATSAFDQAHYRLVLRKWGPRPSPSRCRVKLIKKPRRAHAPGAGCLDAVP